jgi:hypothetical protein
MFDCKRHLALTGSVLAIAGCSGADPAVLFGAVPPLTASDAAADASGPGAAPTNDAGLNAIALPAPPDAVAPDATDSASAAADAGPPSCSVTFLVTGALVDGLSFQGVYLSGNIAPLGFWDPASSRPLAQIAPGVWTTSVVLTDGDLVQFRFLERGTVEVQWEDWGPNSNRSIEVACLSPAASDGGTSDGGGSDGAAPVVGTEYTGQFNVKPPDAT